MTKVYTPHQEEAYLKNAYDTIEILEKEYVEKWAKDSLLWERLRIYEAVMDVIMVNDGEVHVDFGSGMGNLLYRLHGKNPNSTIIGVDNNSQMIQSCITSLMKSGVSVNAVSIPDLEIGKNGVRKVFRTEYEGQDVKVMREHIAGKVTLLGDDIRSLAVLKALLGGRKIDCAYFMNPGTSRVPVIENVFVPDMKDLEKEKQAVLDVMGEVRFAVFKWASELVRPGGKLVYGERFALDENGLKRENPASAFREKAASLMEKSARCWDHKVSRLLIDGYEPEDFNVDLVNREDKFKTQSTLAGFMVLQRNQMKAGSFVKTSKRERKERKRR